MCLGKPIHSTFIRSAKFKNLKPQLFLYICPANILTMEKHLFEIISSIQGNGSYAFMGTKPFMPLSLNIKGVGEIALPLTAGQAKEIAKVAHKAPFGKGMSTVLDTSVRSAWEIDAADISFENPEWEDYLKKMVKAVKKGLGLDAWKVKAHLYKLLLYEEGDFFLPHKDSEKEEGMFGTLVVGLPSAHEGGELLVRYDDLEMVIDFSKVPSYEIPFAAFFADCEHEIKPLKKGYRLCLTYNLVQTKTKNTVPSPVLSEQVEDLTALFKQHFGVFEAAFPKAILLDHQYTPTNFSANSLKLHDKPRAAAIIEAAEKAGLVAKLALVTHYLHGELEAEYRGRSRKRYWDDDDDIDYKNSTMGEIYEEELTIDHWLDDDSPGMGNLDMKKANLISALDIDKVEPLEQDGEGYTGNAGMTLSYWYHFGAIIIWPPSKTFDIIGQRPLKTILEWLRHYSQLLDQNEPQTRSYCVSLIASAQKHVEADKGKSIDLSPLVPAFIALDDRKLVQGSMDVLTKRFLHINPVAWSKLIAHYSSKPFEAMLHALTHQDQVAHLAHWLKIVWQFNAVDTPDLMPFVKKQLKELPVCLGFVSISTLNTNNYYESKARKESIPDIITMVLQFGARFDADLSWSQSVAKQMTPTLPRDYVNDYLRPALARRNYHPSTLSHKLIAVVIEDLKQRTNNEPMPPTDWSRELDPAHKSNNAFWNSQVVPFLLSPTQSSLDYRAKESDRSSLESVVEQAKVDLNMQTIKTGTPYTLRLTKNTASHDKRHQYWRTDMGYLREMEALG
jgi:hypothetical protein